MRRFGLSVIILLSAMSLLAQMSYIYSSPEALYNEGVSLYQQGQYTASYRTLQSYLSERGDRLHEEEAAFFQIANGFEMRKKNTDKQLQAYLLRYPYTPYASEIHFMQGILLSESGKYKRALKELKLARENELFRPHQADYLFHLGYDYLQTNEPQHALRYFSQLKATQSKYTLSARYYYAFCQYTVENYGKALPEFLAIEHTAQYRNIVPYYVIQIYYAQKQYDEVYERAEYLLSNNPENENNGELHRILGEIYYQEGRYDKAIEHLSEYEKLFSRQNRELVRNDMYLLGMSYYQTKDWANAVKYLNKVKKENDLLTENTCYHLGNAYVHLAQNEQAKISYSAAIRYRFDPQIREEAMFNYALTTYESSSAFGESITAFTDFLTEYPESAHRKEAYELMSNVFMSSKNYISALETLEKIEQTTDKLETTKQYLRYQIGADAFFQGNMPQAQEYLSLVIQNEKKASVYKTESLYLRAECYYHLQQYAKAQADLEAFLAQGDAKTSQNYNLVNYSMGYILFAQKQYERAIPYFVSYTKAADKAEATYADALSRIGDCYFNQRQFKQAENYYAQSAGQNGERADYAMFQQGYASGLQKRYGNKVETLEQLLKTFPKSDYADDALYEIARAQLQQDNNKEAIDAYDRLLRKYPRSNLVRKAALEKGMIYYNIQDYSQAIAAYKAVIKKYPNSEEAYSALEGLESAYIETNNINEYLAYIKTLGGVNIATNSREDSITYIAAERQYILGKYKEAAEGLQTYIAQYCKGGRYCTMAQYYLADSYSQLGENQKALTAYQALCETEGNPYMEEACTRAAEIAYDLQDYATALTYFERLQQLAGTQTATNAARLGVLRCSYFLGNHQKTVEIATQIIDDATSPATVCQEAQYNRAKAYIAQEQYMHSLADLQALSREARTATGAEAKYLLCEAYFRMGEMQHSEEEIMSFARMNTRHQFWLAKAFVLLSDIYAERGDDFQAKQYLLSLQSNYKAQDEIQSLITERLQAIEERENRTDKTTEEDEEND